MRLTGMVLLKDNYKITQFTPADARHNFDGQRLLIDQIPEHLRPHPALLREHFIQCLLCRVKGAGAKPDEFDFDFGPGEFTLGDESRWASGQGKSMMEVELARRLHETVV
jgi:hypothetical protein